MNNINHVSTSYKKNNVELKNVLPTVKGSVTENKRQQYKQSIFIIYQDLEEWKRNFDEL